MSNKHKASSLLAPQATGGDTAEGGFGYQASLITAKVPRWLADDGFTEMIRESLGDAEAKFFLPGLGITREFIEYKNHQMTPTEFWTEMRHFQDMDEEAPGSYHRFVLACTGVSTSLNPLINGLRRVRHAFSFYDGAQRIQEESFGDFLKIVLEQGQTENAAHFLFSKVWFEIDLTDAEGHARELFREALFRDLNVSEEVSVKSSNAACSQLAELIKSRKNRPITRQELEDAIWDNIDPQYRPLSQVRIHTIHSDSRTNITEGILQFNWSSTFGGPNREYPPTEEWNKTVLAQLETTRDWIISTKRPRKIRLSGNRRLSASVAIGWVFSSVAGFTVSMEIKDEIWSTHQYPTPDTDDYSWGCEFRGAGQEEEMALGIGIMKDVNLEVEEFLISSGFAGPRLYLTSETPLLSPQHTNLAVNEAKRIILKYIAQTGCKRVHLFIATPSPFALFFGHRLNATAAIQCYERKEPNLYVPSCLISLT